MTDGSTKVDDGFALGGGIATAVVGKPVGRAEFTVDGVVAPAGVVEFASHPQWRIIIADLKVSSGAGKRIVMDGWDAQGKLVVDDDPSAATSPSPSS